MNRLSLIPDLPEKERYLRYVRQNSKSEPITLSGIAQRLRLVHNQMKKRPQLNVVKDTVSVCEQTNDAVKCYLDDIARALLAEYDARRQSQQNLLAYLERLERLLKQQNQENSKKEHLYKQSLVEDTAAAVQVTLKHELAQQVKEIVADNELNNREISRQLREVVAASRFSAQIASLQQQIANIQSTLDAQDEPKKNITTNLVPEKTKEQIKIAENSAGQAKENSAKKTFNRPIIRTLAEKNVTTTVFSSITKSVNDCHNKKPDINNKFNPQQSAALIACARTVNQQARSGTSGKQ